MEKFTSDTTLEQLRAAMAHFAGERAWEQFHTPRNLVLALVGEVGELAEIFQWRGEVAPGLPGWKAEDVTHLGEELSDVLLYLVRLSDRCGVDLPAAAIRKMQRNREKYPVDQAKGRSDKYTAYASPLPVSTIAFSANESATRGDAVPSVASTTVVESADAGTAVAGKCYTDSRWVVGIAALAVIGMYLLRR